MLTNEQIVALRKGDKVFYAELPYGEGEVKVEEYVVKSVAHRYITLGVPDGPWANHRIEIAKSSKYGYGVTKEEALKGARDLAELKVGYAKHDLNEAELVLKSAERAVRKLEANCKVCGEGHDNGLEAPTPWEDGLCGNCAETHNDSVRFDDAISDEPHGLIDPELFPNAIFAKVYGE